MSIKVEPSFALKDHLFNAESVAKLSAGLVEADPGFQRRAFERDVLEQFPALELKARIAWIVSILEAYLPANFVEATDTLHRALPAPLDPSRSDDDFGEFIWVVPGEYVAKYGCHQDHLETSLNFLREATKRFSAEGAIRPFLKRFPAETMAFVRLCAVDDNYHVRRLASEGTRPFLPWAARVQLPIDDVIAVLDQLHDDPTRYVTRSVANSLNDVSKIEPGRATETLQRWRRQGRQSVAELDWMARRALRSLLRSDHAHALEILGYSSRPKFRISNLETSAKVRVGEAFAWRCVLTSLVRQKLRVTLRIHFLKDNGAHSAKDFLVKVIKLGKGERLEIDKRLPLKPATTRTLYPGVHFAELAVNGMMGEKRPFELQV
jgi:3-methyladenine DNA glycosylase AlkC